MRLFRSMLASSLVTAGTLVGAAGLLLPVSTAIAQVRASTRGGFGSPEISKRSLEQFAKILNLDPSQKEAVAHLHEAYTDATRRANDEMQEAMKSVREEASDGDFSSFAERMPKIMGDMGKKRAAAQEAFLSDLKQLLTPAQEANWPALERARRREAHLNFGMVSGSGVDLTTVVDSMKLPAPEAQKLSETLTQYEQDMDRLLQDQEKADEKHSDSFDFNPANFDMEKMKARMDEARLQGIKVRDLNRQYTRRMSAMLGGDTAAKFDNEVKKRSFRDIYREPHLAKMLDAAAKFDDLDPQQKQTIAELKAQYDRDLTQLNDKWAAAKEAADTDGKSAGPFPMLGGGTDSEELKAAKAARKELDTRITDRLKTALNDKQREKLPKKPANDRFAQFGGDAGEGHFMAITSTSEDDGDGAVSDVQIIVAPGGG